MKRRLLFVSNLFPDRAEPYRGLDNATVLGHLASRFEIRVVALRPTLLPIGRARRYEPRPEDDGFAPRYLPVPYLPKIGSRLNHRLMAWKLGPVLRTIAARFPFTAVLAAWLYPDASAVARLAAGGAFRFAAIAQGTDVHHYLRMPPRRRIIVAAMARATAVVTRSAELADQLAAAGVDRALLHPIHNGVDGRLFHPGDRLAARQETGLDAAARVVLFVGNFYPVKNPGGAIAAHRRLRAADDRVHLVLVGGGPLEPALRAAAGPGVTFAGRKTPAEVAAYMRAADALCLPSFNEGLPNVVLEALASGLPVVASAVGGIGEVLRDGERGTLVPAGDEAALAAALTAQLATPRTAAAAARRPGIAAAEYSWETAADRYAAILEALYR